MQGIKHIVECHCILPQYMNSTDPVYHKFVVFSLIDNGDTVIPKYTQCNNCGVIHKVFDFCKSEIMAGKDESRAVITKEDIANFLPSDVAELFESYSVDLPAYEEAKFILENENWESSVILSRETMEEEVIGKRLVFVSKNRFKVEDFVQKVYIE